VNAERVEREHEPRAQPASLLFHSTFFTPAIMYRFLLIAMVALAMQVACLPFFPSSTKLLLAALKDPRVMQYAAKLLGKNPALQKQAMKAFNKPIVQQQWAAFQKNPSLSNQAYHLLKNPELYRYGRRAASAAKGAYKTGGMKGVKGQFETYAGGKLAKAGIDASKISKKKALAAGLAVGGAVGAVGLANKAATSASAAPIMESARAMVPEDFQQKFISDLFAAEQAEADADDLETEYYDAEDDEQFEAI
jgi:hypothetical protein